MNKIKRQVFILVKNSYFPFVILTFLLLFFHVFIQVGKDDDTFFQMILKENNVFEWLANRYSSWSSRLIIEFFLVYNIWSSFYMENIEYRHGFNRLI